MKNKSSTPHIIVTGMHRSGTSYLIRALNLCGAYLGPESDFYDTELHPKIGNPRGHWENVKVNAINEQILKINGNRWDKISNELKKTPKENNSKINRILKSFHSYNAIAYGFKDPRFAITLEKWAPHIPNMVLVGIFRHPLKIAESLKIRNGLDYETSLILWEKHNQKLLNNLEKYGGFLIDFDWSRKKILSETQLVATKLGLSKINFDSWFSSEFKKSDKSYTKSFKLSKSILETYKKLQQLSKKNKYVKLRPQKIDVKRYQEILIDLTKNFNSVYSETIEQARKEIEKHNKMTKQKQILENNPLGALLSVFYSRRDLQKTFPEVMNGEYSNLIEWAAEVSGDKIQKENTVQKRLSKFSQWFKDYDKTDSPLKKQIAEYQNHVQNLEQDRTNLKDSVSQYQNQVKDLEQDRTNLKEKIKDFNENINSLEADKTVSKNQLTEYQKHVQNLEQERTNLNDSISQYQNQIKELEQDRDNIRELLLEHQKALEEIKSGLGFKLSKFYGSKIKKLRRKSKDISFTLEASKQLAKKQGTGTLLRHAKEKIKRGEFTVSSSYENSMAKNNAEQKLLFVDSKEESTYKQKFNASVVIPTNSNVSNIKPLINNILSQQGMNDLEIILVNSGSNDLKELMITKNVKVFEIDPKDFNHGKSRDFGFGKTNGDFVIFLTDDAIPLTDHLFYDLCKTLSEDPKIAVATGRQVVRSDTDLMYAYILNYHYDFLNLKHDRIMTSQNFEELSPVEKRQIAQIDDICSCYRHDILSNFRFNEIQYAEDLDMGLRLAKKGYKIAQLVSTGVVHSHNRPAAYYVKRGFVDVTVLSNLLQQQVMDFKKHGILNLQQLLQDAFCLYSAIGLVIDTIKEKKTLEISNAFKLISKNIPKFYDELSEPKSYDASLKELFDKIGNDKTNVKNKKSLFLTIFLDSMINFEHYLEKTYPNLNGIQDEFSQTLYKLFGNKIGSVIGSYAVYAKKHGLKDDDLKKIEKILSGGV